jgi:hypothetical protein
MTQKLIGWLFGLGIITAIVGGIFLGGYHKGYDVREASDAKLQQQADTAWQTKLDAANANGAELAAKLATASANVRTVTQTVIKEVPKVTTVYKEKPGAPVQAIPVAVITWGFVRLWNDASDPTVKHAVPASVAGSSETAADADLVKSGVTVGDILDNHAANAGQYADCRNQLNALIDFEEKNPTTKSPQ